MSQRDWVAAEPEAQSLLRAPRRAERVADVLRQPGRPLDARRRTSLESQFGHDLSSVRLHADEAAGASARELRAAAYTVGDHVVLDGAEADLDGVVEHEVAHVVQQRTGVVQAGMLQRLPDHRRAGGTLPYREAVEEVERYRFFTPAAARVTDPREPVQASDRPAVDLLMALIQDARTKIDALLSAKAPKGDEWLTATNENIQTVRSVIDGLVDDIRSGAVILRFDQAATGSKLASYTESENTLHIRSVRNEEDARIVLPSLLHEYVHAKQDRRAASLVASRGAPVEHTREAELEKETEARLVDVYAAQLLERAGLGPRGPAALDAVLGSIGFRLDFERMRTGTARQRREGARAIRDRLEGPYASQLALNAPAVNYAIEITQSNTATLYDRGSHGVGTPVDLGSIPASVRTRKDLNTHLEQALRAAGRLPPLFSRPAGGTYTAATFFVFFRDADGRSQPVTEFVLGPP